MLQRIQQQGQGTRRSSSSTGTGRSGGNAPTSVFRNRHLRSGGADPLLSDQVGGWVVAESMSEWANESKSETVSVCVSETESEVAGRRCTSVEGFVGTPV
eukprot:GHVU01040783.1.p1 GENE.GHVU01040783.1~~GHVU01040783.1.p1  ORF type:complete len:100 (+),score=9.15 GHVU01040783.1:1-300(+)